MSKHCIVTTSWDDGNQMDLKLADLMQAKGIAGTFYIPLQPKQRLKPAMSPEQLRSLAAAGFEIGAHGVTEKLLKGVSGPDLAAEIKPCKPALEDIIGREVRMFCYSHGSYDENAIRAVKDAGFLGARTVRMLSIRDQFEHFAMPTTLQCFPHTPSSYLRNAMKAGNLEGLGLCLANTGKLSSWVQLGKSLFDRVLRHGGIWHLYGHSAEIEELNLWKDLAEVLDYVGNRAGVTYTTNDQLIRRRATELQKAPEALLTEAPAKAMEAAVCENRPRT